MKLYKIITAAAVLAPATLFTGCNTDEMKDDVKETPIGSVISGETKSTGSYINRVKEQNKSMDRDAWRPVSDERL